MYRFSLYIRACLLLAACLLEMQAFAYADAERLWTYRTQGGYADSSPAVGDVDGDGLQEIVLDTTSGVVLVLDAEGGERWRAELGGVFSVAPTLANVAGDAGLEVLALSNAGRLWCLDGATGAVRWDYPLGGNVAWGATAIAAADLDGDGATEIVAANSQGTMVCLSGEAATRWNYIEPAGFTSAPAAGDLDGDGVCEVVIGTGATPLLCIDGGGNVRWRVEGRNAVGSSPVLWDIDGDGVLEILVGTGTQMAAFKNDGSPLWTYDMKRAVDAAIAAGDADADGETEIYAVDLSGLLVRLSPEGKASWTASVEERARRSPALADVDGDGNVEILVGGYSKAVHVFDAKGNLKERIAASGAINATPTVANLLGDGRLSVICPAKSGDAGEVIAYYWKECSGNPRVLWPEYRLNAARTAAAIPAAANSAAEIVRIDCGNGYVGANIFSVQVRNPQAKPLAIRQAITRNGARFSAFTHTSNEADHVYELPYAIAGDQPVRLDFSCEVLDGTRVAAARSASLHIVPFRRELDALDKNRAELESLLAGMPRPGTLKDRFAYLGSRTEDLRRQAAEAGAMSDPARLALRDRLARLRAESERLIEEMALASAAQGEVVVRAANPWAPFSAAGELGEGYAASAALLVEAFPGEIESAALDVFNPSGQSKTLRVQLDPLTKEGDAAVLSADCVFTLRETVAVPTFTMDLSADALPELNQAQTLLTPAWEARQLWLTIDTAALTQGVWKTRLHLRPLTVESADAAVELTIQVWETPLPSEQALRLCHWGFVHGSVLKDQPEAALEDQVKHGTNVFVSQFAPKASFDAEGKLAGPIDFSAHDEYVRRHASHGIILFLAYQAALTGPAEEFSPAWRKAQIAWLRAWAAHLAELGLGYDAYALYPVDEPGLSPGTVDRFIDYAKVAREADPKIQIYTDPVAGTSPDDLEHMTPYVDIWCPNRNPYLYPDGAEKLAIIQATGKTVWTYECLGKAKHQTPLGYYRGQAWLAWQHGITGIGFWSYCTSQDDPWFRSVSGDEYLLIYQGKGVVPSKRWEAVLDGIEDYALLSFLKKAADTAEAENRQPEAVKQARRLLGEEAARIAAFCTQQQGPLPPPFTGTAADTLLADEQWAKLQATRREIADKLQTLLAK